MSTETTTTFVLPEAVQTALKPLIEKHAELLARLGALEVDYAAAKARLMTEVGTNQKDRVELVTKAANDAGLDTTNHAWSLDPKSMSLVKQPSAMAPAPVESKEVPQA
jgi:hypothetical protein